MIQISFRYALVGKNGLYGVLVLGLVTVEKGSVPGAVLMACLGIPDARELTPSLIYVPIMQVHYVLSLPRHLLERLIY